MTGSTPCRWTKISCFVTFSYCIDPVEIPLSVKWALASVRLRVRHVPHYTHDDTVGVMSHLPSSASLTTSLRVGCSRRSDRGRHCNLTCRWSVAAAMTSTSPSMSMLLLVSSDACLCARSIPLHLPSRVSAHCADTQAQPEPMRGSRGAGHRWTARDIANND